MLETKTDKMIRNLQEIVSKRVRKKEDRPDKQVERIERENHRIIKITNKKHGRDLVMEWVNKTSEGGRREGLPLRIINEIIANKLTDPVSKSLIINPTEAFNYASTVLKARWPELEEKVISLMIEQDCSYRADTDFNCRMDIRNLPSDYIEKVFNLGDRWPELEQYIKSLRFLDLPTISHDGRYFNTVTDTSVPVHTRLVSLTRQMDETRKNSALVIYFSYLKATRTNEEYKQEMFETLKMLVDSFNAIDLRSEEYFSEFRNSMRTTTSVSSYRFETLRVTSNVICEIVDTVSDFTNDDEFIPNDLDEAVTNLVINLFKMYNKYFTEIEDIYINLHFDMHSLCDYFSKLKGCFWRSLEEKVEENFDEVFIGYFCYLTSLSVYSDYLIRLSENKEQKIADWMRSKFIVRSETSPSGVPTAWVMKIVKYTSKIATDRVIPFERLILELSDEDAWSSYLEVLVNIKKKGWVLTK